MAHAQCVRPSVAPSTGGIGLVAAVASPVANCANLLPCSRRSSRARWTRLIRVTRGGGESPDARTDAVRVVAERSAFWSALAADEQRPWSCTRPDESLPVAVDEERLAAVLDALLGNMLTHTASPAGCRIAAERIDGRVRIRVDDDGLDIPPGAARRGRSGGGTATC